MEWLGRVCRVVAAVILVTYGFAKINGAQFTVLDSELDKPMGQVSGFWLTWYYFGYSQFFGTLVALTQIVVGIGLAFRRTTLLAACVGLGIMVTIVLIDLSFGIDRDATVIAIIAAGALATVVWLRRAALIEVFWTSQAGTSGRRRHWWLKAASVAALLILPAILTSFAATLNNRSPTPLDGTWQVSAGHYAPPGVQAPLSRVYFERHRGSMAVLRFGDTRRIHHFEVTPQTSRLRIWRTWLRKDALIFDGRYRLDGDRLVIRGEFTGAPEPVELRLRRIDVSGG